MHALAALLLCCSSTVLSFIVLHNHRAGTFQISVSVLKCVDICVRVLILVISGFQCQFPHARYAGTLQTNISALERVDTRMCVLIHTEHVDKRPGMLHRSLMLARSKSVSQHWRALTYVCRC